ncbi:glycogen/starch/alpha-glucan phosphorylase [Geminicoccus harenae]|uniref:glycogen/starch/alpha-glucan phosphorylase n=1 Tax=Geminicoccus harenae TaxID=2498453 RepID=UPI00168A49BD|nr:glycogen/starch/alpha-glucan phosphorylase [Geminicoccus harenae]
MDTKTMPSSPSPASAPPPRPLPGRASADLKEAIVTTLRYAVGKNPEFARLHDWYAATAITLRDRLVDRWFDSTDQTYRQRKKRVYYLSLEFLIGRLLTDTASNLGLLDEVKAALTAHGIDFEAVKALEPDAALGNGGLGRLAACFMESMATVGVPAYGYGIRYDFGLFRQVIRDGWQVELPEDWLAFGNPWEFERPEVAYEIGFGGHVDAEDNPDGTVSYIWQPSERVLAQAYDTPVVGWEGRTINTLRLWAARPITPIRLDAFNRGQHVDAFAEQVRASAISRVLYPDDSTAEGQELRLRQEFFFTSASLQDLIRRHLTQHDDLTSLPQAANIQLNDTHPALSVLELTRILVDLNGFALDEAFEITKATLCYTNHTLLPEALETWSVPLFERLLPRHMQLVFEINAMHLAAVRRRPDVTDDLVRSVSLIDETHGRRVRMGNLAFIGSRRVNGVSELHGELMRETVFKDLNTLFPDRITHVTNGITMRRWLVECNPELAQLITDAIGPQWIKDADRLKELEQFATDQAFLQRFARVKQGAKQRLAAFIAQRTGIRLDPEAMFDIQIKRIHEYKRQLLNILETVHLYEAMRAEPERDWTPRVKIFAGKAAASYHRAKLIIKLINDVARVINRDPTVRDKLRVVFLPNYNVSLAEMLVPAADLSEQISTAGMEASGTGNMKFQANGAITIGTMDGANVEISRHVGLDNILIFGLTADAVRERWTKGHNPRSVIESDINLRQVLDAVGGGVFSPDEPGRYGPIVHDLYESDYFMVASDFADYAATQCKAAALFRRPEQWRLMSLHNTANAGWFSSDRSIREYAENIWHAPMNPG